MAKTKVTAKTFMDLLSAVHNINAECEPATEAGVNMNDKAREFAVHLFDNRKGAREGIIAVARLLAEVSCVDDQEAYARHEAAQAWGGDRVEGRGALLQLPS